MKKVFIITLFLLALNSYSQINNDIERSFKILFLGENILALKNKEDKKNLYNPEIINIKTDSLSQYGANILFYKFELNKNSITKLDNNIDLEIHMSSCTEYIIAYDVESKNTFRLQGFKGNDILFLIKEIWKYTDRNKSEKKILSELNTLNIGIDFLAIYKALQKLDFEAECLKVCSDGKPLHGKL
jgi:hypothetical protein